MKKTRKKWIKLALILIVTALAGLAVWPSGPDWDLNKIGINFRQQIKVHLGLDLQGGSHIVYEADVSEMSVENREKAMESLKTVIDRRINSFGVTEPSISTTKLGDKRRLIVELPGINNLDEALELIGKTAKLEFKENKGTDQAPIWEVTGLEGKHLSSADVQFGQETSEPQVSLTFNNEGAQLFKEITQRNIGKIVAIYLDDQPVSLPRVQSTIDEGKAVISGGDGFDINEAKNLAIQLNAGALPVSINLIEQKTVGPTLGKESVRASLVAGVIGFFIVMIFMIAYYRILGVFADIGLFIYALIILALFKGAFLLLPPVTLTLAGIAGFILSIGMTIDTNVLIFERIKEELRGGKTFSSALEAGFRRAWPSVRDSNISTVIICGILWVFGSTMIKGFAYTLFLGVVVSMFTAIFSVRTFLTFFINSRLVKNPKLLGVEKVES